VVLVDEAAEAIAPLHGAGGWRTTAIGRLGWQEREGSVRALAVVMLAVAAQHTLKVPAAEDQQPVEAFGANGADEALGVGVRLWRSNWRLDDPDPLAAEDFVKRPGELAVAVVDEEAPALEQAGEGQVARLLCDPSARWIGRAAGEVGRGGFRAR
jgi:hypothetical protein